jgi:hypothetical protein
LVCIRAGAFFVALVWMAWFCGMKGLGHLQEKGWCFLECEVTGAKLVVSTLPKVWNP